MVWEGVDKSRGGGGERERESDTREKRRETVEKKARYIAWDSLGNTQRGNKIQVGSQTPSFWVVRLDLEGFTRCRKLFTHSKQINLEPNLKGHWVLWAQPSQYTMLYCVRWIYRIVYIFLKNWIYWMYKVVYIF